MAQIIINAAYLSGFEPDEGLTGEALFAAAQEYLIKSIIF